MSLTNIKNQIHNYVGEGRAALPHNRIPINKCRRRKEHPPWGNSRAMTAADKIHDGCSLAGKVWREMICIVSKYLLQDTYHPKGEDSNFPRRNLADSNLTKRSRSASPEVKHVNIRTAHQDALRKTKHHIYGIVNWRKWKSLRHVRLRPEYWSG